MLYVNESVIRGHHVSKDFFMPSISRILYEKKKEDKFFVGASKP